MHILLNVFIKHLSGSLPYRAACLSSRQKIIQYSKPISLYLRRSSMYLCFYEFIE